MCNQTLVNQHVSTRFYARYYTVQSQHTLLACVHGDACILHQNMSFRVLLAARYPLPSIRASYIAAKRCAVFVITKSSCSCSSGMSSVLATANENLSCRCASVGSSTLCPVKYSVSRSWAVSEAPSNPALFKTCRTACTLLAVVNTDGCRDCHACLCAGKVRRGFQAYATYITCALQAVASRISNTHVALLHLCGEKSVNIRAKQWWDMGTRVMLDQMTRCALFWNTIRKFQITGYAIFKRAAKGQGLLGFPVVHCSIANGS